MPKIWGRGKQKVAHLRGAKTKKKTGGVSQGTKMGERGNGTAKRVDILGGRPREAMTYQKVSKTGGGMGGGAEERGGRLPSRKRQKPF